jgi:hypothetical protein
MIFLFSKIRGAGDNLMSGGVASFDGLAVHGAAGRRMRRTGSGRLVMDADGTVREQPGVGLEQL